MLICSMKNILYFWLQRLTGGILLSRNKDFLVFYRGKNFLSADVAETLLERERLVKALQDEEEQARLRASSLVVPTNDKSSTQSGETGTLGETLDANARWGKSLDGSYEENIKRELQLLRHAKIVKMLERKLAFVSSLYQESLLLSSYFKLHIHFIIHRNPFPHLRYV